MKNINKDKLISSILLIIGVIGLTFNIISNQNRDKVEDKKYQGEKVNKEQFAMYIGDGSGDYVEYKGNAFPNNNFLNMDNSQCIDINNNLVENAIKADNNGVTVTSQKTVFCNLYFDIPNFTDYLLDSETMPSSLWTSTLTGDGYRFVGTDPSNYICFGTTNKNICTGNTDQYMYRIIGIFQDSAGNNHLKLIKKEALNTKYAWHTSNTSDVNWGASSLYTNLHGDYFLSNTAYPYMQNTAWTNLITNWTWSAVNTLTNSNSGTSYYDTLTASQIYYHEMNSSNKSVTAGAWTTPTGKIGIMYVSDFMLSLGESSLNLTGYSNRTTLVTGWMHLTKNDSASLSTTAVAPPSSYEWTMARYGTNGSNYTAWFLRSAGFPNFTSTAGTYSIRPVFYLNSDVQYLGGTGTSTDPYILYTNADNSNLTTYKVTVESNDSSYGTLTQSSQTVLHGNSATFTLEPASGYMYISNDCGGTVSGNTLTISNVTANTNCTVTFAEATHTVTATSNSTTYGSVSPAIQTVSHGNSLTFTLSPASGYEYKNNTCGGTVSGNTLTISNVTNDISCTVNFGTITTVSGLLTVSVSSSNTLYGGVSPTTQTVLSGGTATITLSPKSGYQYYSNTCGGTVSGNTLTISNVTSDITCKVTFGIQSVTS